MFNILLKQENKFSNYAMIAEEYMRRSPLGCQEVCVSCYWQTRRILRSLIITLYLATFGSLVPLSIATAQITPDNSLGSESSVVSPDVINGIPSDRLDGGAIRGSNLFHSFQEFNISEGRGAYFSNPNSIANILTRVTGGNPSNILGKLGVLGDANLFLINPKGIVFGSNASLDLKGSFVATTADSLVFDNNFEFSATNPQAPPLLTVSIPVGLRFRGNTASITNSANPVGLAVQSGKSLSLIGGNVNVDGGILTAPGGRVFLGGLAAEGTVEINPDRSLSFPDDITRADVLLTNAAIIDVADKGSGSVAITARNLNIEKQSRISAGIKEGLIADGSVPGDINLNATGLMAINQNSLVENVVTTGATGNAGDVNVYANRFELTGGGRLRTRTLGKMRSDAGDINIKAGDIYISNPAYELPGKDSTKEDRPTLNAGNYKYDGIDGFGAGRSGDVSLEADSSITLIGEGVVGEVNSENKVISTYNGAGGTGGGDISLKAKGSISLDNAYLVTSSINRDGAAGNISLQGDASVSLTNNSGLAATTYFGTGNPGNITLRSNGPVLVQSSLVTSDINSPSKNPNPNNGNIFISGQSVLIADGSEIAAKTGNDGNFGGNIQVDAVDLVEISGRSPFPLLSSRSRPKSEYSTLVTTTQAKGPAGNITVNTDTLRVADGASLKAATQGAFPGGNITVNARVVELTGGGKILASASRTGNAGNIILDVSDRIAISGENPNFKEVFNQILTKRDTATAESRLDPVDTAASGIYASTSQNSTAKAGNIVVTAGSIKLDNRGAIKATANSGDGGNLSLNVKDYLLMEGNSIISTSSGNPQTSGNGGNILINDLPNYQGFVIGTPSQNSDITANAFAGQGGQIIINSYGILGFVPRTRTELEQLLNTTDAIQLDPRRLPTNDITAISQQNPSLSGTVQINTLEVDPSQGLTELPENVIDPSDRIAENPCQKASDNTFIATGRGGLPTSPNESFKSDNVRIGLIEPVTRTSNSQTASIIMPKTSTVAKKIAPAQGWVLNDKGEVVLTAYDPTASNPQRASQKTAACPAPF
ncbi:two-partner secretion domain-containing protein [Fischerella sp. PCC 9605]|uniref:two-partner secretion domain-containing protein n=1 Tax=Fischerella sp. PCC 9605 TaxID=1173024 RepID=UPI0004AE62E2|nr:S-layer family protein [Fischerella sp. PCC 9605]